jgi:tetratricopeptide (TPR) repeat protein
MLLLAFFVLGSTRSAITFYDRGIAILEPLANEEGQRQARQFLAAAYTNQARALSALGKNRGAVALTEKATAMVQRLVNQEGRGELADNLAMAYMNKGIELQALGSIATPWLSMIGPSRFGSDCSIKRVTANWPIT